MLVINGRLIVVGFVEGSGFLGHIKCLEVLVLALLIIDSRSMGLGKEVK